MEECIQHFSHEHPLSFFQLDDDEDSKPYGCSICGLPILSSPSYTCKVDANCNFFLHKPCTQLPRELYYDDHFDTLNLEQQMLSPGDSSPCRNFTYRCQNYSLCKFDLHPLVANPMEIKSKHISNLSHPLVAFCREIMSKCDVCGEEHKGFFFYCQDCRFWIHQDCTILPSIVKLPDHPHPFILSFSLPFNIIVFGAVCLICNEPWRLRYNGVYFCCESYRVVHVTCAKSKMENLQIETIQDVIQLPDKEDKFPSLVIRRSAERDPSTQKCHEHPLILEDGTKMSSSSREACGDLVCDVCIQPIAISSPFYRCEQQLQCHFLAHDICANNLPTTLQLVYTGYQYQAVLLHLVLDSDDVDKLCFNSVFHCVICYRPSNGFIYGLFNEGRIWGFCHIECAFAPKIITHASHRQHLLFQMIPTTRSTSTQLSCCSGESLVFDIYSCVVCDFSIHIRCALLPRKTQHKFDEHPLELIMSTHDHDIQDQQWLFCELCEQEINLKLWYYGCKKCMQYFHINCIPSVDFMSKVKFGKTLYADDKIHPHHPLTLTRMLTHGRHETCGACNQIIKGFSNDEMAFHCSTCHFWIHFSCASAAAGLMDYSQHMEKFKQQLKESIEELPMI